MTRPAQTAAPTHSIQTIRQAFAYKPKRSDDPTSTGSWLASDAIAVKIVAMPTLRFSLTIE
jgi:hypothetical protein